MKGIRLLRRLSFLLALVTAFADAAGAPPRLWEVAGRGGNGSAGRFYLLAVTHNGLDAEYDGYFYRTVVPIALKADIFFHEAAVLVPREVPACPTPLADTEENREILRQAYLDTERALYDLRTPLKKLDWMTDQDWVEVQQAEHWSAHNPTSRLTEYGLVASIGTSLYNTQLQHAAEWAAKAGYTPKPDVDNYLAHERWIRGIKKDESIDSAKDLVDVYCSIDSQRRGKYLQRKISENDPARFVPMSRQAVARLSSSFIESIKKGVLSGDLDDSPDDEYSRHAVCDRNEKWLTTMRTQLSREGTAFYALGAAHLLQPSRKNATRCDGLLKRLRQEGYTVTLVK